MTLKAVLFDFNGIIINDERIHAQLIEELLLAENLRVKSEEVRQFCLGRSDRAGLKDLLAYRGRAVNEEYLDQLIKRKAQTYQDCLQQLETLPIYNGVETLVKTLQEMNLKLVIVSGALRSEVELVLTRIGLLDSFSILVTGDDITHSKPEPEGYLLAVERLNQADPSLNLHPQDCLALEDTFAGIEAARRANISVVGVAHTYPLHLLQRRADWCLDYLSDLDLEHIQKIFEQNVVASASVSC